ncbi:DUF5994 family protein [Prauserella oleivorans]|uniref:DUF5994 family protein n=1 Tax=Prauserella oleivorans TaxID=1478153 RepID=A0ABW5WD42_9PSEU
MISAQSHPTSAAIVHDRPVVRLEMKVADAARGYVDGGWWPQSTDPATEFSQLCVAVQPWVGAVSRVSYHLGTWGVAPRKIPVDGRVVRLEGFTTMQPQTVVVVGTDSRRVSLLVVPPGTPETAGSAQLRSAAGFYSIASVDSILKATQRD